MSRGLSAVIRSGVRRRRVQTVVLFLVAAAAVTASVLGAGLLVASRAPFDRAFAAQRGAHLTVQSTADAAHLAATRDLPGVTAAAGPYPMVSVTFADEGPAGGPMVFPPMTVVGRADPGGDVDRVTLLEGRWPLAAGEVVLSPGQIRFPVNTVLTAVEVPGTPSVTVVGLARSVSRTAELWATPAGVAALGEPAGSQMLYRFASAATPAEVTAGRESVEAAVPVSAASSWLDVRRRSTEDAALFVPFLVAFAVLGLLMSALVVGTVVAGAVGAAVRRIGVLKALGCTPAQVVRAYAGQAVIPAAAGTLAGVVAGNLLALPLLAEADEVYGVAGATLAWWVDVLVAAGVLALVGVTAALTALRAGRLRTVEALAVGRATGSTRGRAAARIISGLRLPRPVGLGLARPFARPARAVALLLAIASGAAAATFAVGLGSTLVRIQAASDQDTADVVVDSTPDAAADPAAVLATIAARPGTAEVYAATHLPVTAAGLTGPAEGNVVTGDSTWDGIELIHGRWYAATPGEAVVSSRFLAETSTAVGDRVSLRADGNTADVTIVGEVFDTGLSVHLSSETLRVNGPREYPVRLAPGTDADAYRDDLKAVLPAGLNAEVNTADVDEILLIVQSLTTTLALLLAAVAALGVLNTVVLDLRDRVHDLGVVKALGMTPRQTVTMVLSSILTIGLLGGLLGVPAGVALQRMVVPAMARIAGITVPEVFLDVYGWPIRLALLLGGLLIAVVGALMPAGWAARVRVATALRTE